MPQIEFTQFLRPNGRRQQVFIDQPDEIVEKASMILQEGFSFECEELTTGQINLTISDQYDDWDQRICSNGPDVPLAVGDMIENFDLNKAVENRNKLIKEGE